MAKISFMLIFTLTLIISAISRTSGAMPGKKCTRILNPYACMYSCNGDCQDQYHGIGYCVEYPQNYKCVCVYDCPS
ncbi:hypothetical protein VIGAN_06033300 [Vigna angularis var. angularis]|uniref:Knottin scorpion toxin-like domain-containing protein n=1 Tax=Vigna angularis var. angularis TaxID=157739 RepID=A0A0S3S9A7_PHAAN|nr:hypothetical protein VIGAN_06033300 [Vigna angularis var. angularis]